MNRFKTSTTICSVVLMSAVFVPNAKADDWNRKTVVTFSAPVEIPGVHLAGWGVLPAGTYVFKILDSQSDRHIVQIFNQDETKVYATILAIPNYRIQATDKTVITFRERPAGQPEALRAWFYPGRNWGEEFVYPKAKAAVLAKETQLPVLFATTELPIEAAEPADLADRPVITAFKSAPIMAIQPTGQEVELAQVVTPPPAQDAPAMPTSSDRTMPSLPSTASTLPLLALFGCIALAGAFAVRMASKRLQ